MFDEKPQMLAGCMVPEEELLGEIVPADCYEIGVLEGLAETRLDLDMALLIDAYRFRLRSRHDWGPREIWSQYQRLSEVSLMEGLHLEV